MALQKATLGQTGMEISRVGFGAWAAGGAGWFFSLGPQEDNDSVAALRYAIESGVNWVDTAGVYGLGHSEEVVAKALKGIPEPDRPYIFTKCGLVWDTKDPYLPAQHIGAPKSIRSDCEASLRRLQVEAIDLLQMHWPAGNGSRLEDYWGALLQLKEEGKIRSAGLSNHVVTQLEAAETLGHVDTLQTRFSAIRRVNAPEVAWCASHSTGVIAYSPMETGLLAGTFSTERLTQLHEEDSRRRNPEFQGERLAQNLALADAVAGIAQERGTTAAAVAVAWVLAWPGITGAIVGARSARQVQGWLAAANLRLWKQDLEKIARAIESTRTGRGPIWPND